MPIATTDTKYHDGAPHPQDRGGFTQWFGSCSLTNILYAPDYNVVWKQSQWWMWHYKHQRAPEVLDIHGIIRAFRAQDENAHAVIDTCMDCCAKRWQTREGTYQLKQRRLLSDVRDPPEQGFFFFPFLHCRTSARHCRSTTGMSEERNQIFPKAKANKNKHTHQTKQHPQKAKPGKDPGKFARYPHLIHSPHHPSFFRYPFGSSPLAQDCLGSSPRGQVGLGFQSPRFSGSLVFFLAITPQWFPETYCSWLYFHTTR